MKKRIFSLVIALTMVMTMIPGTAFTAYAASGDKYTVKVSGAYDYGGPQEMMTYINEERAQVGSGSLTLDKELTDVAMQRAAELAITFSHTRPDNTECYTISSRMFGENIAAGNATAQATYTQWRNSYGHYMNMIESSYTNIGIGHFYDGNVHYWVQVFSRDKTSSVETRTERVAATAEVVVVEGSNPIRFNSGQMAENADLNLMSGKTFQLIPTVTNSEYESWFGIIDADSFDWSSSNNSVATVDQTGLVTAKNAGTAVITAAVNNGSRAKSSITVNVRKNLSNAVISDIAAVEYTGSAITPKVTVTHDGKVLTENKDYTVSYYRNTNAGIAYVIVEGIGHYSGSLSKNFTIKKANLTESAAVKLDKWDYSDYTGATQCIKENLTVTWNGTELKYDEDYYISTNLNKNLPVIEKINITFKGNYSGSRILTCLDNVTVTKIVTQEYTGSEVKPTITVNDGTNWGSRLTEGKDYKLIYENNVEPGTARIKILPLGDNYGSSEVEFKIGKSISKGTVSGIIDVVYTGSAVTQKLAVVHSGKTLTEGKDYTVSYSDNTDVGIATVTVSGIGEYIGTITKTFEIKPKDITTSAKINVKDWHFVDYLEIRDSIKDKIDITYNGKTLIYGEDYYLSYSLDTDMMVVSSTEIHYAGNYSGEKTLICLDNAYIYPISNQLYTGSELRPVVDVYAQKWSYIKYTEGVDYKLVYSNNINTGTGIITILPIGENYGSAKFTFNIEYPKYNLTFKGNGGTVSKTSKTVTYNSKYGTLPTAKRSGYTFAGWYTARVGGTKVTASTVCNHMSDKTLYAHWKKVTVGRATVKAVSNLKGKKLKVTIGKVTGAKGYQIVVATNAKFTKGKKIANVKTAKFKTFKNLNKKKYYVKIRAYKLDSKGNKVYGKYSKVKTIRIKK